MLKVSNIVVKTKNMRCWMLIFIAICVNNVFCQDTNTQDANTIKKINQLIKPNFQVSATDTIYCGFFDNHKQNEKCSCIKEIKIDKNKQPFIVAVANGEICPSKVFVLSKTNYQLKIMDSSASFCFDKGCNVEVRKDTIILNSLIHHAGYSFIYLFNSFKQKYYLQKIKYFEVVYYKGHYLESEQIYILKDQQLLLKSYYRQFTSTSSSKQLNEKKKSIKVILPKDLKLEMSAFIDPNRANNTSSVYDKIFISSGKLYEDMNKF